MITEAMIEAALDDIDEDDIEEQLRDEECFHTGLAKALVSIKCYDGDAANLTLAIAACMDAIDRISHRLAEKEAREKDNARRFQAPMRDDDWDDYKMRMTA